MVCVRQHLMEDARLTERVTFMPTRADVQCPHAFQTRGRLVISKHFLLIVSIICSCTLLVAAFASAKILFYSSRTGNHEIYMMNDDGSHIRRLTDNPMADRHPRWSPDGKRIVFERGLAPKDPLADRKSNIFVMDADGRHEHQLTDAPETYEIPSWHPDGTRIMSSVYLWRGGHDIAVNIVLIDLQTGKVKQLTKNLIGGLSDSPDWSPDGRQIVFEHSDAFGRNIWTMTADGKHNKRRSPPSPDILLLRYKPRWSPDGVHILYPEAMYRRLPGKLDLASMRLIIQNVLAGTREIYELPKGFLVTTVCWMSDGRELLFSASDRNVSNVDVIYRYPLDTRELIPLTDPRDNYYVTDWRPGDSLSVSPKGKLTGLWARIKQAE